jgi:hypothetical protein
MRFIFWIGPVLLLCALVAASAAAVPEAQPAAGRVVIGGPAIVGGLAGTLSNGRQAIVCLDASQVRPAGKRMYRFALESDAAGELVAARLWICRSATAVFTLQKWTAVSMTKVATSGGNRGVYGIIEAAELAAGSARLPFLAVRGEIEVIDKAGKKHNYTTAVLVLPTIKSWSFRAADGSRRVYAQPSEAVGDVILHIAYAATRDFGKAQWHSVQMTQNGARGRDDYKARVAPTTKLLPWVGG